MAFVIPQAIGKGLKIGYWLSVIGVVIALLLILISIIVWVKGESGTGWFISGLVIGSIASYGVYKTNVSTFDYMYGRFQSGPAMKTFNAIKGMIGRGEDLDNDINEEDYIESSDDDAINPIKNHGSKKVRFNGAADTKDNMASLIAQLELHDLINNEDEVSIADVCKYIENNLEKVKKSYDSLPAEKHNETEQLLKKMCEECDEDVKKVCEKMLN